MGLTSSPGPAGTASWLRSVQEAFHLGRRLSRGRGQVSALIVLAGIAAASGIVLAAVLAAPATVAAQREAQQAATITMGSQFTGLYAQVTYLDWKDDFRIRRISVAAASSQVTAPPGLLEIPRDGEVWLFPGLQRAAAEDPALRELLRSGGRDRIIPARGLSSPDDMIMYVGASPAQMKFLGLVPTASFGGPTDTVIIDPILIKLALATITLFVIVPLGIVLVSALGQLATRRSDRQRTLDMMGVRRWVSRTALTVDGTGACVAGALVGLVLFALGARAFSRLPGVPASWWASQVQLSWWHYLLVPVLLGTVAALSAVTINSDEETDDPPGHSMAAERRTTGTARPVPIARQRSGRPRPYRVLPLLIGVALAALTYGQRVDDSTGSIVVVVSAVVLLTIGIPLAVPLAAAAGGRILMRHGSASSMLAGARLVRGRPTARRASVVMAAAVILATAAAPLVAQAAPRDTQASASNEELDRVVVEIGGITTAQELESLAAVSGVLGVSPLQREGTRQSLRLPCPAARRLLAQPLPCRDGESSKLSSMPAAGLATLSGVAPDTLVRIGTSSRKLTRLSSGADPYTVQAVAVVTDVDAYWRLAGHIAARTALGNTYAATGGLIGGAGQPYLRVQEWLRVGLTGLLAAAAVAVLLGVAEDTRSRRRSVAGLLAIGTSARQIRSAHRLELVVRLGATTVLTIVSSMFLARIAASWSGAQPLPPSWIGVLVLSVSLTLAAAVLIGPLRTGVHDPLEDLRAE